MAKTVDDSIPARVSAACPDAIRELLYFAWSHDVSTLKQILDGPETVNARDPETLETPLHAAIRSCGPKEATTTDDDDDDEDGVAQEARETIEELFYNGAIWNDADNNNETPGCVALRLGQKYLYQKCVEAGVRAEMLFGVLGDYDALSSVGDEEEENEEEEGKDKQEKEEEKMETEEPRDGQTTGVSATELTAVQSLPTGPNVTSEAYLKSDLTYDPAKLVDSQGNGVMMAWESEIMRKSVRALLSTDHDDENDDAPLATGKRILNIGLGMGIIDKMFAATNPSRHHIIEAHPAVLAHIATDPDAVPFGPRWEASAPEAGAYRVWPGKWQDIVPQLIAEGLEYDAIYFDTFGEDYAQLRLFFTEYLPLLLCQVGNEATGGSTGRFSFFHGLGADRQICYDVYTQVAEMHLSEVGLETEWTDMPVPLEGMAEAGKGEWDGVAHRYWTLSS